MICFNVLVYNIRITYTEKKKARSVRFSPVITALLSGPRPAKAQGEIVRGAGHNFHFAGLHYCSILLQLNYGVFFRSLLSLCKVFDF